MFVVALSVLFSFVCFILSLMLIHNEAVLAPACITGLNLQHDVLLCYNICAFVYFSWNALVLLLFALMC